MEVLPSRKLVFMRNNGYMSNNPGSNFTFSYLSHRSSNNNNDKSMYASHLNQKTIRHCCIKVLPTGLYKCLNSVSLYLTNGVFYLRQNYRNLTNGVFYYAQITVT